MFEVLSLEEWNNKLKGRNLKMAGWSEESEKALGSWHIKKTERPKCLQDYHPHRLDISKNYMCFSQIASAGAKVPDKL